MTLRLPVVSPSAASATSPRASAQPYIEGWFQVGLSADLRPGQLRKLRQFGRDFALFRGLDGAVGVVDDVCPHLGAHFSEGGTVKGNCVRCPYHFWAFDREGACAEIPYAKKIPSRARVKAYPVVERYGIIFMHRSKSGDAPTSDLPTIEDFDPAQYSDPARYEFRIRIRAQDIMENSVDSAHFWAVHGHNMPENTFRVDGRHLRVTQQTSVKRFGATLRARLEFHLVEPGFHYVHFPELPGGRALVLSSIVPEDREYTNHRLSLWISRSAVPGLSAVVRRFLLWQMMKTYREDMRIWESKEFLPHPVLCDGDGAIVKLRTWFSQFHEPTEPSPT